MLKKFSVRTKILGGYVLALFLCAVIMILSVFSLQNTRGRFNQVIDENVALVTNIQSARVSTNAIARYIRDMQMNPDATSRSQTNTRIQELRSDLLDLLPKIEAGYDLADGYGDQYVAAVENWLNVADQIIDQILRGDTEGAVTRILNECTPALNNVASIAVQASTSVWTEMEQIIADSGKYADSTRNLMIALFVVGLI